MQGQPTLRFAAPACLDRPRQLHKGEGMTDDVGTSHDELVARAAELERRLVEVQAQARARVVHAELKAEAVRAGMVDLDGLKLLDASSIKVNEAGEVEGAAMLLRDMRRAKPWLFGAASSSSVAQAPGAQAPHAKLATEMGHEEWQAARRELLKRR